MEILKKNQCRFQWIMVHHVTEQRCHLYICIKNTNVNRTFSASSQSTANIPVSDRGPEDNYADLRPWLQTMHFHECEETLHGNSNSLPISKRTAEQTLGCDLFRLCETELVHHDHTVLYFIQSVFRYHGYSQSYIWVSFIKTLIFFKGYYWHLVEQECSKNLS